jgi:N-acetylneuraminate synthase/N,N'-diacetyllegionaminate synthase
MNMVNLIRHIERWVMVLNGPIKSEKEISKIILKSIVAKYPISKGKILTENNLAVKRLRSGIDATH